LGFDILIIGYVFKLSHILAKSSVSEAKNYFIHKF